ncbi:class I SAM-dependent methyltransferase [Paracidobacterium acidisoli]|uniref:Class I SAM-dependent methyltransferase n=1 Tax=Paracidobacterium acidisoli TaxID=2303751 RepID=A0A372IU73_9BACT|nr:class I SAM-dependent methyltransferase [Paracidobacterium acidisoli]MBT9329905.1 class I SAM-dependent methyltransferase [Paracidobacterium acidisoli]
MIAQTEINAFMTLVRRDNTGNTGWTRSRSSLRHTLSAIEAYNRTPTLANFNYIETCIGQIPGAKQTQYAAALARLQTTLQAEKIIAQDHELLERLSENTFRVNSGLSEYTKSFGELFTGKLRDLGRGDIWLDGGSGEAKAMIEYLEGGGRGSCVATGYEIPSQARVAVRDAEEEYEGQFHYVRGKYFSDITDRELGAGDGEFDLITDLNGVLYYTKTFEEDLTRYLQLLKVGGLLFCTAVHIEIAMEHAEGHDARRTTAFARWASNIKGVTMKVYKKTGACIFEKTSLKIKLPELAVDLYETRASQNDPLRRYTCNHTLPKEVEFL